MFTRKPTSQSETNLFAFRPIQKVFVGLIAALLISLIVTRFAELQRSQHDILLLSESAAGEYELNVTLRESMAYVAEYGQWLNGLSTRRELQIRRALLAQRLVVEDTSGVPSGERVSSEYLKALSELDLIVFLAQPGYLSIDDRVVTRDQSNATLNRFLTEARAIELQIVLAKNRHERTVVDAETRRRANVFNLLLTANLLVLALGLLLAISRSRDYRKARSLVLKEREQLVATQTALNQSRQEAREQVELEEIRRREVFRLDSLAMPILSKIRGSIGKQQIIDELIAGVGASIAADWVIFHAFPTPDEQRILAEWRSTGEGIMDQTEFLRNEVALVAVITEAWNGSGFVTIPDSQLLDTATLRAPSLVDVIRQTARSWVVVPLGEGSQVFGYITALMYNETRDWSSDEISFVQTLAANATHSIIHLRSLQQAKLIAEHDEVVNRLIEIDRTRKNFIANVNHELRTPLTSIIGFLEIIQESADTDFDPDIASSFNIVMRNARRLQTLVGNILLISSLDSSPTVFDATPIDLGRLLRELVDSLAPIAQEGEVTVNLVVKDKNAKLCIEGNSSQIEQLFTNLISNAIKFTPKTGTVTVTAQHIDTENGAAIEVTVRDTGIGIPAEEADGLFQRFTRGSNALDAMIPGSGLGLTIVKDVVDIHRGSITFTSKIGKGTKFTVQLPVLRLAEFQATAKDLRLPVPRERIGEIRN